MPQWSSFGEFGREIGQFERDAVRSAKRSAVVMAERAQQIARSEASSDLGGDPKFSGWAPELDTIVRPKKDGAVLLPTRSSAGPWTVAEFGRNQGGTSVFLGPGINRTSGLTSRTKSGGIRKVRTFKAKRWNGYTQGKGTGSRAARKMERELPRLAELAHKLAIRRHFDST